MFGSRVGMYLVCLNFRSGLDLHLGQTAPKNISRINCNATRVVGAWEDEMQRVLMASPDPDTRSAFDNQCREFLHFRENEGLELVAHM